MALRKSSVLTGLFALVFSCWVAALGLGELTLHSGLDEPFNAEIELVNIGDADENQIFVALGSQADFERAGVAWEFHLLDLKFKTDLSDAEHPVVKVSSTQSIKEPYLDFIAKLEWPSGRLLRGYTLFLDLPVFDVNQSIPATESAVSSSVSKSVSKKASSSPKQKTRQEAVKQTSVPSTTSTEGNSEYRVKGGDTLWKVAARAKLESTTVQQHMVAIHAENPRAFVNGNANLLKKGAVLRMPELASVRLINQQQVNELLTEQPRPFNEGQAKNRARELIGDVPTTKPKGEDASADGLLRLSTPTDSNASKDLALGRTVGGEGGSTTSDVLQNELGIAQEELDRTKRENLELKAKLAGLEAQLSTTTKLLELESDDLKAVQLGVTTDQSAEHASSDIDSSSSEADSSVMTAVDNASGGANPSEAGSSEIASEASYNSALSDRMSPTDDPVKGPLSGGVLPFLYANWMPLLGLLVVLLGVLLLIVKSKKDDQSEQVDPFLNPENDALKIKTDNSFEENNDAEQATLSEMESVFEEPEVEAVTPAEVHDQVDPIGEADIYLSLGNFSEAEQVIEKAIEAAPSDSKLHLKRLDLFAVQHDAKGFEAYYPTLVALGDDEAIATADRLRGNIQADLVEAPVETTRELTLEERVAEELGIEGLELDLSDRDGLEAEKDFVDELDDLALETNLESSFVSSDESGKDVDELVLDLNETEDDLDLSEVELDLSEIELDLKTVEATPQADSETSDEGFEDALFGDISLPDELESDELELPELASEDITSPDLTGLDAELKDIPSESEDDAGFELSLDSFDFDNDDDLDLEVGEDESNTQIELAQAYVEMGDESGAKDILAEVLKKGSDEQKQRANELLAKLS